MEEIIMKAPAKINLTLDVTGRQENGYHDLRMLMQTIDLHDELTLKKTSVPGIQFNMNKPLPDGCPTDKNLVYRAADLMCQKYQIPGGIQIHLNKQIPAAAGLAGGSTDCAATLLGINALYELNISQNELCAIGVSLGADVPFCICQGTMLSEGIGEILTPLPDLAPLWALLIKPNISVSTAHVYTHLDLKHLSYHPDTDRLIEYIKRKNTAAVARGLSNVLETVTIPEHPEIAEIKTFFNENAAIGALMSGSGPTTYGLYQDEIQARMVYKLALEKYPDYDVILCQTKKP